MTVYALVRIVEGKKFYASSTGSGSSDLDRAALLGVLFRNRETAVWSMRPGDVLHRVTLTVTDEGPVEEEAA